ncbi:MAG: hypothetical protein ACOC8H_01690 [bacterium]
MTGNSKSGDRETVSMEFRDDDEFYARLESAIDTGKSVVIDTPFRSQSEVPPRLAKMLQFHRAEPSLVDARGSFAVGATAAYAIPWGRYGRWLKRLLFLLRLWVKKHVSIKTTVRPDRTLVITIEVRFRKSA